MDAMRRTSPALVVACALAIGACADNGPIPPKNPVTPQRHTYINFAPDAPEAEYAAVCKVGPPDTYSFHAEITAGVGPGQARLYPTADGKATGKPILMGDTDLDGKADYQIVVQPTDFLTWGGSTVQGECLEGAGDVHTDVAFTGGPDVTIAISEVSIPAGKQFVKTDVYSRLGTASTGTNSAALGLGNPVSVVIAGNKGANVLFYNELIPNPSLTIAKTADAASVGVGADIGFTITVNSNGPGIANNVVLNDPLPVGASLSWTINPAVSGCSISGNALNCSFGDMAAGASASVHITSPTGTAACTSYDNTAVASADNHAAVTASASITQECPPQQCAAITAVPSLNSISNWLFVFSDGRTDANWQGATKGFRGNVAIAGIASKRTSGGVPFAGTIYTDGSTLGAWQNIVNQNAGQAFASPNAGAIVNPLFTSLQQAFGQINAMAVNAPAGFNGTPQSLNGLNTQNDIAEVFVLNVTSGFGVSSKINIKGDARDLFILRWDSDANFGNGYQGQVKFQSGGAIVPSGGLTAANFVHVAGDINASGGGSNPAAPYPQGPNVAGGANWNGGGFFTGYWLTTGDPVKHETASLSNAIFVGGWYSTTTKFSMTSGTSGVHVECLP